MKSNASYVEQTLAEGEEIRFSTKFHWWYMCYRAIRFCYLSTFVAAVWIYADTLWRVGSMDAAWLTLAFWEAMVPIVRDTLLSWLPFLMPGMAVYLLWSWLVRMTTEQALTSHRVVLKVGIIARHTSEFRFSAVESIAVNQSIWGRILGYGDLHFTGRGGKAFAFAYVPAPGAVRRSLEL